jgi:hypothetical protein
MSTLDFAMCLLVWLLHTLYNKHSVVYVQKLFTLTLRAGKCHLGLLGRRVLMYQHIFESSRRRKVREVDTTLTADRQICLEHLTDGRDALVFSMLKTLLCTSYCDGEEAVAL